MYRTGDIVRQNVDGSFTFVGRDDDQVKIRGQRVELSEIQHWVTKLLPEVRTAAVDVIRRGAADNEQVVLALMLEMSPDSPLNIEPLSSGLLPPSIEIRTALRQLRESLHNALPPYMVPSVYIPFGKLPLNASGKLDRPLLRQKVASINTEVLQQYLSISEDSRETPSTPAEQSVQRLWASALGIKEETIGLNDNFFQIGGDSVTAMRVVSAARASKLPMTVAHIFQNPRLSDLARVVDQEQLQNIQIDDHLKMIPRFALWDEIRGLPSNQVMPRIQDIAEQCGVDSDQIADIYPCTPLQEGLMAISASQNTQAYIASRTFRLRHTLQIEWLQKAWARLVELLPILYEPNFMPIPHFSTMSQEVGENFKSKLLKNTLASKLVSCRLHECNLLSC